MMWCHTLGGMICVERLVRLRNFRQMTLKREQSTFLAIHDTLRHSLDNVPAVRQFELRHILAGHHGFVYSGIPITIRVAAKDKGVERISVAEKLSILVGVSGVEQYGPTRQTSIQISAPGRYDSDGDTHRCSKGYQLVDKCEVFGI